ncbi:MAG: zinc-binding dehydrogenase [Nitrososphaera sp.]|jgi:NADPH:quinone reductase-like Zn-dependent oxidoreductase
MRAAPFFEHGPAGVIRYHDSFPDPAAVKGNVAVRVECCGVNHLDIWTRQGIQGRTIRLPHICGCDIVGRVEGAKGRTRRVLVYPGISCGRCIACRSGAENLCSRFAIIGGMSDYDGGYAELVSVPARNIIDIPSSLGTAAAATLAVSYLTAWNMLRTNGAGKNSTLLVYGGSSGIGMATIQLSKALGVPMVITTASTEEKRDFSKDLGADYVIDTTGDIAARVSEITGGRGVDIVIDHVGAATWTASISSLKQGGRMAVCGMTSGNDAVVPVRAFYTKQLIMTGALLGTKAQLAELVRFVARKKIHPVIDSVFALKDARLAQERMESGRHMGKILIDCRSM